MIRLLALLLAFLLPGCSGDKREENEGFLSKLFTGGKKGVPVTVANAVLVERPAELVVPAVFVPSERVDITLPYDVLADRVFVSVGDRIDEGDALFHIAEEEITFQLGERRTALSEAQTALERNSYLFNNRDRFLDEGRMSQNEYDTIESTVTENRSSVESAQDDIGKLERQLERTTFTSPIGGVIESRTLIPNVMASAETTLMSIATLNPIDIEFELASSEATAVTQGQSISVAILDLPGAHINANVVSIGSNVDRTRGSFVVRARISNPDLTYKGGMEAEVKFTSDKKQRYFSIPQEAVIASSTRFYVFIVDKGVARKARITPRGTRGDTIEVIDGLREDDLIIVRGHEKLKEGTVVDIWGR